MDFQTLKYFLTIVEEDGISKAAKTLNLSQPALSHCIKRLEKELGLDLFDRSKKPMILTLAGERYSMAIRKIVKIKEEVERELTEISEKKRGSLSIGISIFRSPLIIPQYLPLFQSHFPLIEVHLEEDLALNLEKFALQGKTDITILGKPISSGFNFEPLFEEKILLACPPDHFLIPILGKRVRNLTILKDQPFLMYISRQRLRRISDSLFENAGFRPHIALETQSAENIVKLCAQGLGFAIVSESAKLYANKDNPPVFLEISDPPLFSTVVACWPRGIELSWSSKAFIDIIKAYPQKRFG